MTTPAAFKGEPTRLAMSGTPFAIWMGNPGGSVPILVFNMDGSNPIYLGYSNNIAIGGGNTVQLPAQSSATMDGSRTIYAIGALGVGPLQVIPGGQNFFQRVSKLTIPIGATSGVRIVIDGIAGTITGFDASNNVTFLLNANSFTVGIAAANNPQVQMISQGGVGVLQFLLNSASYTNPNIDAGFASTVGVMALNGPKNVNASHDDWVGIIMSAADGTATHFANLLLAYNDISGGQHALFAFDGSGTKMFAVSQLTATDPTTGTGPTNVAIGETWHDMRPLSNSFVGTIAGRYPPQYRKTAEGDIEVVGYVSLPASYNGVTFATLPAAYRPGSNSGFKGAAFCETNPTSNLGSPNVQVDTTGAVQLHNLGTGLSGTTVGFYLRYPLDNTGLILS